MLSNKLRLILIFYRPIFVFNFIFSLIGLAIVVKNGWALIMITMWIKASIYALSCLFQYLMVKPVFYFYRNAGLPVRKVMVYAFGLDMLLYFAICCVYLLCTLWL